MWNRPIGSLIYGQATQVRRPIFNQINPLLSYYNRRVTGHRHALYNNTVIGPLTVDGWARYIWYSEEEGGAGRARAPPSPLLVAAN